MSYAIREDGKGWRAVNGDNEVGPGEVFSETLPLQSPGQIRADKWEKIKAQRESIKVGGVKVGTKWYHTDTDSRIQHLGLKDHARDLIADGQPDSTSLQKLGHDVRWKTMDGSFIYLTVKHAFDIVAAIGDLDAAAFATAETHKAAMEQSEDPSSYDFSTGWPDIYTPS